MYVHGFHFRLQSARSRANSSTILNLAIQEIITSGTRDFQKDETDYRNYRNYFRSQISLFIVRFTVFGLLFEKKKKKKKFELEAQEATTVLQRFLFLLRDFRRFISGQTRRNHGDLIACFPFLAIALFTFLRLFYCSISREMVVPTKLRRTLFEVHRPKFDPHVSMHLHRSLPLVSTSDGAPLNFILP
ncbi:hypothetical protein PUN28_002546 [Cardiocondyla obscurior]|uniref:Uncharacterized protein n=1 Tax=Cardiocondyla obscurior TaxID=286306 RepID=A0AAW2GUP1_9HYME